MWIIQPAESARAVTGRRCPHSGEGEDFLTGQLNFLAFAHVIEGGNVILGDFLG